jgi:hypothetical protein
MSASIKIHMGDRTDRRGYIAAVDLEVEDNGLIAEEEMIAEIVYGLAPTSKDKGQRRNQRNMLLGHIAILN